MSADFTIHIMEGITEEDLKIFHSNTLGSKWGPQLTNYGFEMREVSNAEWDLACKKISKTPQIWIGEVSWLKANFSDNDSGKYVPDTIQVIEDIFGKEEVIRLTDDNIEKIKEALKLPNNNPHYDINHHMDKVLTFLNTHKGKKAFTVSW